MVDENPLDPQEASERFHALVWPLLPTALRIAKILTGNDADAEELAQEAMLKAFRSMHRFQTGTDCKSWLMTILRNAHVDQMRKSARKNAQVSLEHLPEPAAPKPSAATDIDDIRQNPQVILSGFTDQQMINGLQDLPEEIRWTLLLIDVEGMKDAEAAAILEVPVGTVKSRAHRGRAMLRNSLLSLMPTARALRSE